MTTWILNLSSGTQWFCRCRFSRYASQIAPDSTPRPASGWQKTRTENPKRPSILAGLRSQGSPQTQAPTTRML